MQFASIHADHPVVRAFAVLRSVLLRSAAVNITAVNITAINIAVIFTAIASATGCSTSDRPPLGQVEGFVTLDGRPLSGAAVLFTPEGPGRTSIGVTDAEGRYSLTYLRDIAGADLGRHLVRITTATDDNKGKERLPKRYHAKTELSAAVAPGENRYDFSLRSR